jgi:hypothetical protein
MILRTREALSELLARTFPHARDIEPETLDAFVDGLMRARTEASAKSGQDTRASSSRDADPHRILSMRATHARRAPVTSVFTATTHSVWVRLPLDEPVAFETEIGAVLPTDHLLPTVQAVRDRFGDRIGRPFERVDLLTPARTATRFSPMSLYFGYLREDDDKPSFVIYEPGDATGNPGALYLGESLDTVIEEQAGYKPTPLSSPEHWYVGGIRMASNGRDPDVLYMSASDQRGGEPHFRLHVEYTPVEQLPFQLPAADLVEAALRMLAVQKGCGCDQMLIERCVAETGLLTLPWVDRPDNAAPAMSAHGAYEGATMSSGPFVPCTAFDGFIAELPAGERETFQASIAMLLAAVVRADGRFDRLERVELDWRMNFEVPSELGDAFRFSGAAEREYQALLDGAPRADRRPFEERLRELGRIVARLPTPLRQRYGSFVIHACQSAAEASGTCLWFGTKVGDDEKRVLDRMTAVLGLEKNG